MTVEFHSFIQLIKEEITSKFGRSISYAKDCQELSQLIMDQTKRQVSPSTLKRFFEIVESPFGPSRYTLDTLSIFLKFNDWQDFMNHFEKEKHEHSQLETWENLKKRTDEITNKSLTSIRRKLGTRIGNFPHRKFADRKFMDFLSSKKVATALIAPDGYGKTPIIVQIANKFFTGQRALYPNDAFCIVDGSILYNLVTINKKISRLYNLIEFDPKNSFSSVFREHPELVKGRFVLIIDGIDDIYSSDDKTSQFIDNLLKLISTYEHIEWFKLLITCTPRIWQMFSERIAKNALMKSFWHDVTFQGAEESMINIPLLRKYEIAEILQKNQFSITVNELHFKDPGLSSIIKNPYFLHLYVTSGKSDGGIRDTDLLYLYVKKMVLSPPYLAEKHSIWTSYFTWSMNSEKCNEVNKKEMRLSSSKLIAYNELVRMGLLYEYSIVDEYLSLNTYASISHNILFAFYLANFILTENKLTIDELSIMVASYQDSSNLQQLVVEYLVKILFKQKNIEILKDIFSMYGEENSQSEKYSSFMTCPQSTLVNVVSDEMRKNPEMRQHLLPFYAQSKIGSTLFFEQFFDIDHLVLYSGDELDLYIQYNHSTEAKRYVHFLKFMQYFLSNDIEQCRNEYEQVKTFQVAEETNQSCLIHFFAPIVIYQSVFENKVHEDVLAEIYRIADQLLTSGTQPRNHIPMFEIVTIFVLHYGKMSKEIIDLSNHVFENYELTNLKSSSFYQFFLSVYASALLEIGEEKKAIEFYEQVKFKRLNLPKHMKYYIKIRLMLIKVEFLIYRKELQQAKKILNKIKTISQNLQFNYFYHEAFKLGAELEAEELS